MLFSLGTYTKNSDLRLPNAAGGQYLGEFRATAFGARRAEGKAQTHVKPLRFHLPTSHGHAKSRRGPL